ncbi:hypothetical protein HYC85_015955 [Camellia sinensis]|uniref:Uncharacterized protein n=1 Tax=Camellia sinensis TaxID=4442 RepID=A0A7J7GZD9_CAMSI|nr:hypothetical protein HYC85_015955 [Camellia sinensis]
MEGHSGLVKVMPLLSTFNKESVSHEEVKSVFQLRRFRNLRALGMYAGLPKFVPVNLKDIEASGFQEGEEVSLASLKKKGLINPSGRERRLPLKVSLKRFLAWRPTILQCNGRTGGDS